MSETKKVGVAEIIKRANEKKDAVKASTEKIAGQTNSFKILPKFSKYEFNGIILRNIGTKSIIKFKTGRTKYQIKDDKGESHNLSNDDLKKLLHKEKAEAKTKKLKEPKSQRVNKKKVVKVKKEKIINVEFEANKELDKEKVADLSKKEIVSGDHKNHKKHYMLYLKGCTVTEINELTNKPIPSIKRDIWRYEVGKTVI